MFGRIGFRETINSEPKTYKTGNTQSLESPVHGDIGVGIGGGGGASQRPPWTQTGLVFNVSVLGPFWGGHIVGMKLMQRCAAARNHYS